LHGRHNRRRLEAEEIHDALLAISGSLDESMAGPSHTWKGRLGAEGQGNAVPGDPSRRRGVYLPIYRGGYSPDLFQSFDFPDSGLVTGRRNVTTVPTQALFLLNSPVVQQRAKMIADRLLTETADESQRIRTLYQRLFARPPTPHELARARAFLKTTRTTTSRDAERTALSALCHTLMISNEFLFVD
jgi:hypothetical protein